MGGISTNTGLVSGLPIGDIIDQLMSIEARPRQLVEQRNSELKTQQSAFQDINAKLLALKESSTGLTSNTTFNATTASSSNENVLTATSDTGAVPGNYNFTVSQLVSAQQTLTRGFQDATDTSVGAGTLTFDRGEAGLQRSTELRQLNGGDGADRGKIRITDRAGNAAVVDLSKAVTIDDVTEKINGALDVNVTVAVSGDQLTLTDNTGSTASNLIVEDVGDHQTATSLGLAKSVSSDTLTGDQINTVSDASLLNNLNDGNGISVTEGAADFRITSADATTYDINIGDATTLGDVIDTINDTTGGQVTASVASDGVSLQLTDSAGGGASFTVAALNDSEAANDLGLIGSDGDSDGVIGGHRLVSAMNSKLTRNLNGGNGVSLGTIAITDRTGASGNVDLSSATSISDIIEAINNGSADVTAALNNAGNGIRITDNSGGSGDIVISDVSGTAAADLSLDGSHSADSVNSGNLQFRYMTKATRLDNLGVSSGRFTITDSSGDAATVDLTQGDETTIGDVIKEINSRGISVNARINDTGDGILLEDTGPGNVKLKVEEAGSTTARDLGILGEVETAGENLDGSFEKTVDIESTDALNDVVTKINDANVGVQAAVINDGSGAAPHRLLLSSEDAGSDGAFVFDDGALEMGASTLAEAQDATVFFGAADPADALVMRSKSNQLDGVIPSTTIDLQATSDQPVQVTVSEDRDSVVEAVSRFVEKFNGLTSTLDKYDKYDAETEQRGALLGDPTVSAVRRTIFRKVNERDTDLTGQFKSLAEIGITVGSGATLELDESKLRNALDVDAEAVKTLFTLKETEENETTGETEITKAGLGVEIEEMLKRLTNSQTGIVQDRLDAIEQQIGLNDDRIEQLNDRLEAKRQQLRAEFTAMEQAIAGLQQQGQALSGLRNIAASGGGGGLSSLQQLSSMG